MSDDENQVGSSGGKRRKRRGGRTEPDPRIKGNTQEATLSIVGPDGKVITKTLKLPTYRKGRGTDEPTPAPSPPEREERRRGDRNGNRSAPVHRESTEDQSVPHTRYPNIDDDDFPALSSTGEAKKVSAEDNEPNSWAEVVRHRRAKPAPDPEPVPLVDHADMDSRSVSSATHGNANGRGVGGSSSAASVSAAPGVFAPSRYKLGYDINILLNELHRNQLRELELVDLERTRKFTDYEMVVVAQSLKHNSSVQFLKLVALHVTDISLVPLFEGLVNHPTLCKLELRALDGKDASAKALVRLIQNNPRIIDVQVSECHLSARHDEAIAVGTQYNVMRGAIMGTPDDNDDAGPTTRARAPEDEEEDADLGKKYDFTQWKLTGQIRERDDENEGDDADRDVDGSSTPSGEAEAEERSVEEDEEWVEAEGGGTKAEEDEEEEAEEDEEEASPAPPPPAPTAKDSPIWLFLPIIVTSFCLLGVVAALQGRNRRR